jgi:tetratricopeptide (TPR) repeat protein
MYNMQTSMRRVAAWTSDAESQSQRKEFGTMKTSVLVMLGVLGLVFAPAFAEGPEIGDKAPEVSADKWFNLPSGIKSLKPSHLEGQIVIVEFWATRGGPGKQTIPRLAQLHEKFKSRGVVIVSLSDEDEQTIEEFMRKTTMPYIVGSGAKSASASYGVNKIPATFLVGPDGKIVWKGHAAEVDYELERLLKENPPTKKGLLAAKSAEAALKDAKKLYEDKKYPEALRAYEEIAKDFKDTKPAKDAQEQVEKIKGNSRIMEIIKAEEAERISSGWLEVARGCQQYGEKDDALKYYRRIIKEYPDTKAATVARDELMSLGGAKASAKDKDESEGKDKGKKDDGKKDIKYGDNKGKADVKKDGQHKCADDCKKCTDDGKKCTDDCKKCTDDCDDEGEDEVDTEGDDD